MLRQGRSITTPEKERDRKGYIMSKSIVGQFDTRASAEDAIRDLLSHGISADHVGMVSGERPSAQGKEHEVDSGEAAGAAAAGGAAAIAGLVGFALPGVGTALLAGAVGALGAAGAAGAEDENENA